jgi:hypothetical protein
MLSSSFKQKMFVKEKKHNYIWESAPNDILTVWGTQVSVIQSAFALHWEEIQNQSFPYCNKWRENDINLINKSRIYFKLSKKIDMKKRFEKKYI